MGLPHAEKVMFHDQNSLVGRRIGNLCIKKKKKMKNIIEAHLQPQLFF